MPLFDYYCKKCQKAFEIQVKLEATDKMIKCPYCKRKLEKMFNPIRFKVK